MKLRICLTFLVVSSFLYSAMAMAPKHSEVVIATKAATAGKIAVEFKAVPQGAIVINDDKDSPWQLTLSNPQGINFAKLDWTRDSFDKTLGGFSLESTAAPTKKDWRVDYKFIVFVCTKNKEQCFREVHKGTYQATAGK